MGDERTQHSGGRRGPERSQGGSSTSLHGSQLEGLCFQPGGGGGEGAERGPWWGHPRGTPVTWKQMSWSENTSWNAGRGGTLAALSAFPLCLQQPKGREAGRRYSAPRAGGWGLGTRLQREEESSTRVSGSNRVAISFHITISANAIFLQLLLS